MTGAGTFADTVQPVPLESCLVERIRNREVSAFESLYRAYHSRLSRFLNAMTHRPTLVEEVLNDTMMIVWNRIETFDGTSKLSTWIFAIAYRQTLSALRKWDEPVEDFTATKVEGLESSPDASLGEQSLHESLTRAMSELSPAHRSVVDLTYFHDLSYREIAEITDCPVDTVKTRMFHARRHLRRIMPGDFADWI